VQSELGELNEHLQLLAGQLIDQAWNPDGVIHLSDRLQAQKERYVMQSQVSTHDAVTGGTSAPVKDSLPKIELF
jgi:hypothetical protein